MIPVHPIHARQKQEGVSYIAKDICHLSDSVLERRSEAESAHFACHQGVVAVVNIAVFSDSSGNFRLQTIRTKIKVGQC